MPSPPIKRAVRLLRFAGALAVLLALVAIAGIAEDGAGGKSGSLIAAAIILGAGALLGLALTAWSHLQRQKDEHDPRP